MTKPDSPFLPPPVPCSTQKFVGHNTNHGRCAIDIRCTPIPRPLPSPLPHPLHFDVYGARVAHSVRAQFVRPRVFGCRGENIREVGRRRGGTLLLLVLSGTLLLLVVSDGGGGASRRNIERGVVVLRPQYSRPTALTGYQCGCGAFTLSCPGPANPHFSTNPCCRSRLVFRRRAVSPR